MILVFVALRSSLNGLLLVKTYSHRFILLLLLSLLLLQNSNKKKKGYFLAHLSEVPSSFPTFGTMKHVAYKEPHESQPSLEIYNQLQMFWGG